MQIPKGEPDSCLLYISDLQSWNSQILSVFQKWVFPTAFGICHRNLAKTMATLYTHQSNALVPGMLDVTVLQAKCFQWWITLRVSLRWQLMNHVALSFEALCCISDVENLNYDNSYRLILLKVDLWCNLKLIFSKCTLHFVLYLFWLKVLENVCLNVLFYL